MNISLLYHSIDNRGSRISVDKEVFERQVAYLRKKNFNNIVPEDLKNKDLKGSNVLICFDDGFRDNLEVAEPILKKYGYTATVFIATKYIGSTGEYGADELDKKHEMMSVRDIKDIESRGWVVANHFHSHRNLSTLSEYEIKEELSKSKKILEGIVDEKKNANIFSYPRSKTNELVFKVMKEMGVEMVFVGERNPIGEKIDFLKIPRVEIDREVSMQKFKLYLHPSFYLLRRLLKRR